MRYRIIYKNEHYFVHRQVTIRFLCFRLTYWRKAYYFGFESYASAEYYLKRFIQVEEDYEFEQVLARALVTGDGK